MVHLIGHALTPLASGTAGSSCSHIFIRTVPHFLAHICFSLCQSRFKQGAPQPESERSSQPTHTLELDATDHLAAPVEKGCFFPSCCLSTAKKKKSPGPGSHWTDLGHVLIPHQISMHLCLGWGGGLSLKDYMHYIPQRKMRSCFQKKNAQ